MFPTAELICRLQIVASIVAGQFTEDSITEVNIDDLVVLSCLEKRITWVLFRFADSTCVTLAGLLGGLTWILDLSDFVPLFLSVAPHESKCDSILAENLDKAV